MALDGIAVHALAHEMNDVLSGARVDKIHQPEKDEITVTFRSRGGAYKLLLSASASNPRAHFTDTAKKNPMTAPMFCMFLRKHLSGGKLVKVVQPGFERCLEFWIESYTELGDLTVKRLIIEIMGRYSNIVLTDEAGKILDSIKHIDITVSSMRQVLPGLAYEPPPPQDKIDPLTCEYLDVVRAVASAEENLRVDKLVLQSFAGISPLVAREVCFKSLGSSDLRAAQLSAQLQKALCDTVFAMFEDIRARRFAPCIVYDTASGKPIDFSAFDVAQYGALGRVERCGSVSEAADKFYLTRDAAERQKQKSAGLLKRITNHIDRCAKKIVLLQQTIDEANNKEQHKLYADLLTANLYRIAEGAKAAVVENYYDESLAQITIPLDVSLSPQQNAQRYYKKYNKAKVAQTEAARQMALAQDELAYLESAQQSLSLAKTEEDLAEIRAELAAGGYMISASKEKKKKQPESKPLHFISSDGFDIYVGKNNVQNDRLTLRFANSADLWFHTKNFPGSHTVIKLGLDKNVPERTILEAASLAAYHSSARGSAQVPVDYTQIKNVKKPSGAKPGMVIYDHYNTLYVTPDEELALRLTQNHM